MGETTQEERTATREYLLGDARWEEEPPAHVHETALGALNDADRLAAIETRVRSLANRIESGAAPVLEDSECVVDELRAILGEDE